MEACYRSMQANLDGLGQVLEDLDAPERIAETLDELSLAGSGLCLAAGSEPHPYHESVAGRVSAFVAPSTTNRGRQAGVRRF